MSPKPETSANQAGHLFAEHLIALTKDYTPPTQADEDAIEAIFAEHRGECDRMADEETAPRLTSPRPR